MNGCVLQAFRQLRSVELEAYFDGQISDNEYFMAFKGTLGMLLIGTNLMHLSRAAR